MSSHHQHLLTAEQILFLEAGLPTHRECIQVPVVMSGFVKTILPFGRVMPDWLSSLISSS